MFLPCVNFNYICSRKQYRKKYHKK